MKCPFCGSLDDKVIDSRTSREGDSIRRRRVCLSCDKRFTSYERVEDLLPLIVKKDNRRESFDRQKVLTGLRKACQKRPVSADRLEAEVEAIEKHLQAMGLREVPSSVVGERIMESLRKLDKVAYVRFASVYRDFKDVSEFMEEVKILTTEPKGPDSKN